MNVTVLVTGGSGFIGTNLVRRLAGEGARVRVFVRSEGDPPGLQGVTVDRHVGDVRDRGAVARAVRGCDVVFHLAGSVDVTETNLARMREVNVVGTDNVCRAALGANVSKVVYTSSCVTVGYGSWEHPATEEGGTSLAHLRLPYVASKTEAEACFLSWCARGLPGVAVLPGYVFGPWDERPKLNRLLILAATGKLNFYFSGGLNVVSVEDVVEGHLLASKRGRVGERYLLTDRNLSYLDFFTLLNRIAGYPPPWWPIPTPILRLFGGAAESAARWLGRPPALTAATARLYGLGHYVDATRARRELGFRPSSLEEAVRRTYRWLHTRGHIPSLPPALRRGLPAEDHVGDT